MARPSTATALRRRPARTLARRAALAASFLLILLATAGCTREPGPPFIRLTEHVEREAAEPRVIATGQTVAAEPWVQQVDLSAVRVDRLQVRGRGTSEIVKLGWKLSNEAATTKYRALSFPVIGDGEEHVYEIDLRREPYWAGHVHRLIWSVEEGEFEIVEATALASADGERTSALGGISLPVLPGSEEITLLLPAEIPHPSVFETRIGLLPRFNRPEFTGHFRAVAEDGTVWLDETLSGGGVEGWKTLRRPVRTTPGMRLTLETRVTRGERSLPSGTALWGAPALVRDGRDAGPNLIVLVIDTLRADFLGAYGDDMNLSPRLDALAEESVVLDDLVAPSPWTLPSTASLLTGFQPQTHGAGRKLGSFAPTALNDALTTLAEVLRREGLRTVGIYNNIYLNPSFGFDRGFDEYAWISEEDVKIVDHALERLEELQDQRFFLFLHLFGPHHPYTPRADDCQAIARPFAPDYAGEIDCEYTRPPFPDWRDRRWIEGLYRAEITTTDRQVGRFLDRLETLGLDENTVLILTSDHGETFWERAERFQTHGYEDQDHGNMHYRELVRVPGLVRAPNLEPRRIADPVELADLFPTALSLVGIDSPRTQGMDLSPVLHGERAPRRTLISDRILYGPQRWSVRRGPWKLIVPEDDDLPQELYNLAEDPAESRDLAAERPDIAADLLAFGEREIAEREELRRELRAGEDVLDSAYLEWNHITKLKALGYLQ
ncbi:MAG: sulfatase [Acidobacteriota bacterium]